MHSAKGLPIIDCRGLLYRDISVVSKTSAFWYRVLGSKSAFNYFLLIDFLIFSQIDYANWYFPQFTSITKKIKYIIEQIKKKLMI